LKYQKRSDGNHHSKEWLLSQTKGRFLVFGNATNRQKPADEERNHFVAVDAERKVVADNKNKDPYKRFCYESIEAIMPRVYRILKLEKRDDGA